MTEEADMDTWRCPSCGRVLAQQNLTPGSVVRIKCHSCNAIVTLDLRAQRREPRHLAPVEPTYGPSISCK